MDSIVKCETGSAESVETTADKRDRVDVEEVNITDQKRHGHFAERRLVVQSNRHGEGLTTGDCELRQYHKIMIWWRSQCRQSKGSKHR